MTKKILVIALGGTIGSVEKDKIDLDSDNLKILNYYKYDKNKIEFVGVSPFSVLSENMNFNHWQQLIDCLKSVDFNEFVGVIILHGSDTLAYTSALLYNVFNDKNIALVASDKPIENKSANGIFNFGLAVNHILKEKTGVFVAYNKLFCGGEITSANENDKFLAVKNPLPPIDKDIVTNKKITVVNAYYNMDFDFIDLSKTDVVICKMFHSATVPNGWQYFAQKCSNHNVKLFFVTHQQSANYISANGINNIFFSSTVENIFARVMLQG